jgi:drebrin-like protein
MLQGYHVQITARSDRDLTPESIIQKVSDASGAKYTGGSSSNGPPPPISSKPKPAFTPTRVGGGGAGFNPLGSRSRSLAQKENVDEDGWGADAPPVTRTQLEKVQSAYQPTKVNIADLTSQKQEPSRFSSQQANNAPSDVVKGGYQPIGKVDIAALRREARERGDEKDDRPTAVKGAYEPVGKVDIAAIRARAQGPQESVTPADTRFPSQSEETGEQPKSLAERSAAFSQSERLTTLPKPKVANKFGGGSSFTGTKAPTPGGFSGQRIQSSAPVGTASKTYADEGGKTPAQLWAEKKAKQGGGAVSPATGGFGAATSPGISTQKSGDGGWKSTYTGKTWAPVQTTRTGQSSTGSVGQQHTGQDEQEEPTSPAGGVSAMRDRFKGAAPMGAPSTSREGAPPSPPPMDMASKPNIGGGVPMPGLPSRSVPAPRPEEEHVNVPPPPQIPRSPTPPSPPMPSGSPVRIAMPVSRGGAVDDMEPAEELHSPPPLPTQSIAQAAASARAVPPEPLEEQDEPGRGTAQAVAASKFGEDARTAPAAASGGKRALVQYDYEKAEDNEIELHENEYVTNIDMVDEDWWMGTNAQGETGLFPSNYVELVEDDDAGTVPAAEPAASSRVVPEPEPPAAPAASEGPTATALYDYEAAEDNELSFPDGAKIMNIVSSKLSKLMTADYAHFIQEFPDEDWWLGTYNGKSGLFPANYVELNQ